MEALQAYNSDSDSDTETLPIVSDLKRPRFTNGSCKEQQLLHEHEQEQSKHGPPPRGQSNQRATLLLGSPSPQTTHQQMPSAWTPVSASTSALPPPPADLLNPSQSVMARSTDTHGGRIRSFPHVEGNYALHVYIPVPVSSIAQRQLEPLINKASVLAPELQCMEFDVPLYPSHLQNKMSPSTHRLRLAKEYHISLSRTVPIRVHQIDSIVSMLRHRFHSQKTLNRYRIEFGKWDVFVNDERTRSFLALEATNADSSQICRQVYSVNEVFRLHNLPTFYQNPRPHISMAWALGDLSQPLRNVVEELNKLIESGADGVKAPVWSYLFSKVECKIGNQTYLIWQSSRMGPGTS